MTNSELIEGWLASFGENAEQGKVREYVTSFGNHLWHLFSYQLVPCLEKDAARRAFNKLHYTEAIKFHDGQSGHIQDVSIIGKVSAEEIERESENGGSNDVYLVANDFSWTYVCTHERGLCGPYLCVKTESDIM